jgi:hypothetical protein
LVLIILGFFLIRLLSSNSRRSSFPPDEGWTFCPHCGQDLRQVRKVEGMEAEKDVSLPRT